jgi:Ca-activated chloride channel family protein
MALLVAAVSAGALAASPRALIAQGNEHYAAGRYQEALECYTQAEQAAADRAPSAELLHDLAAAQFKLGNLDEARELWVRALALKDAAFEARVRYNLGNCNYAAALKALQAQQSEGVLEALQSAVEQYRDALALDPGLADARANLELATQLKRQLEQIATSQPQSQPSQCQDQPQQQPSSQPCSQPSGQQEGEEQKGQDGQPDRTSQPSSQPCTSPATQPQERQPPPEPSTRPADESEPQPPPSFPEGGEEQAQELPEQGATIHMTREEAERLLQKIRDAEKARREVLRQREAAKQKPVDRDW